MNGRKCSYECAEQLLNFIFQKRMGQEEAFYGSLKATVFVLKFNVFACLILIFLNLPNCEA